MGDFPVLMVHALPSAGVKLSRHQFGRPASKAEGRDRVREGNNLRPDVTQAQSETEYSFRADTEISKYKQNICLVFIILDVNSGRD